MEPDSAGLAIESSEMQAIFIEHRSELEGSVRRRLGSADGARDVVHDVFLRWLKVGPIFQARSEARAYLFRMAKNLVLDQRKLERRRSEILASAEPLMPSVVDGPEGNAIRADQVKYVEAALAELPKHCRQVLILSRVHGMTHAEIASQLGVSRSLVEKYAVRALMHCRKRLNALDRLE